jgi:imidazolonepropionase-like amidohydrolase
VNAAALLRSSRIGEIAVGAAADFVVVTGRPLRDLRTLERPELVIQAGRVVRPARRRS